jgi:hypothetical protein
MQVGAIIEAVGGREAAQRLMGVGSAQVSHMYARGYIPAHHVRLFIALFPELDWYTLLHGDTLEYTEILLHPCVQSVRQHRLKINRRAA